MSGWYIDSVRIFVQDVQDDDVQIIARLNPLGGGTTLHTYGDEDEITKIQAYIVGFTDKTAIKDMTEDDAWHTITSPWASDTWGSYKVKSASFKLTNMICQTLRPDLDEDAPVFMVNMELYLNE